MEGINRQARVVYLMKDLGIGGTQKTAQLFLKHLRAKHSNTYDSFVLYNAGHELSRFQEFSSILGQDRMIPYRFDNQGVELLQALRPDIVHVFRAGNPEWPVPGKDIKQTIFVETNVFGFLDPNPNVHKSLFMSRWLMDVSNQHHGDAIFDALGRSGRFDFINNPVDLPVTDESTREAFINAKMIEKDTIILGRCGRPDDGIYDDINVKAALVLQSKGYNIFFLTMAAPPRMLEDLEKYSIRYQNIEPTADASILSKFYNTIDVLAHARADGETFGSNIAEAMMHGKPVVTHIAVPSHPGMGVFQAQTQLVNHNVTGYVSQYDVSEYAKYLELLVLGGPIRRKLGTAGKEWALTNCATEVCGEKLHKVYQDLLYRFGHVLRPRS